MQKLRSHSLRSFSALIALLWIAFPVASTFHADAHAHVYCVEHGSVEEAPGGSGADSREGLSSAVEGSAHESCAFLALTTRSADVPPAMQLGQIASLRLCGEGLSYAEAEYAAVPVLHRAPKSSPPRA